jgi:hypothetical protein
MIYQLSYELRSQDMDYSPFYSFLENLGNGSFHVLRDTWWIYYDTEVDVDKICDEIHAKLGKNDIFVLTPLDENCTNGWLATSAWSWRRGKMSITDK